MVVNTPVHSTSWYQRDRLNLDRLFVGRGIDVGAVDSPLLGCLKWYPGIDHVARLPEIVESGPEAATCVDFLHAAHQLEGKEDPLAVLEAWLEAVKPGGVVIFTVIDRERLARGEIGQVARPSDPGVGAMTGLLEVLRRVAGIADVVQLKVDSEITAHVPDHVDLPTEQDEVVPVIVVILRRCHEGVKPKNYSARHALIERALRLYKAGEFDSVLDLLEQHADLAYRSPDILNAAAAAAFSRKARDHAIQLYRRAVRLMPEHYDAWNNLGIALFETGRLVESEAAHRRATSLRPEIGSFKSDLIKVLLRSHQVEEAERFCTEALERDPASLSLIADLGAIYARQGKTQDARERFLEVLGRRPDSADVALQVGTRLFQAGYCDEAERIYRDLVERAPTNEMARFHLSLLLLLTRRYEEGWALYEARAAVRTQSPPEFQYPAWKGEELRGRRILVAYEQGFGDEVMVARFCPILKKAGAARVGLLCRKPMLPLMCTLEGVDILTPEDGDILHLRDDEFDFWTLPFEMPRYLNVRAEAVPGDIPYLHSLPERRALWRQRMPKAGFTVGIVWKGSTLHVMDEQRSLSSIRQLAPLWNVPNVSFVSLQKGQAEDEARSPPVGQPLMDLGALIKDFGDTAAIIDQLDLVISVDTSIVHVAGALGKPCWVLLPCYATDWRWMLERTDSPWYPSLRLFRQGHSGSWDSTIASVSDSLMQLAKHKPSAVTELAPVITDAA